MTPGGRCDRGIIVAHRATLELIYYAIWLGVITLTFLFAPL